jgi:hypothetical protein
LLLAAGTIKDNLGKELFRRLLVDIFDDPNVSPTATHMLLPKIPFRAVLTSNGGDSEFMMRQKPSF